tara:strand:+ start:63 stop:362 length:300 start_codon:yes stop_codon:yes gene_type:complete
MGKGEEPYSPRIHGGNVSEVWKKKWKSSKYYQETKYVIVQHRIENDKNGKPMVKEVLLAYPDLKKNAERRLFTWKSVLEIENLRIREAQKEDYRKRKKS